MEDNKFAFEYRQEYDLTFKIVEAVKEWRTSSLEFDRLLTEWHEETDGAKKEALWQQYTLSEKIRDGNLAELQMLADRCIEEGESPSV